VARVHVFGDEAGNFDFSTKEGATRFFSITTATFFDDRRACDRLQGLRYDLAWEGAEHDGPFHATTDSQAIRDRVFVCLAPHGFRVDCTVIEKRKANPRVRLDDARFYQFAWYYHMKSLVPQIVGPDDELLVIAASVGTRKRRSAFRAGVANVVSRVSRISARTANWPAHADTGLQIADYCSWAIQRKWERDDDRSHLLIRDKIRSEYELFARGNRLYY
jgi:hypothetical protein